MPYNTIIFDKAEGIATITLNRPKVYNAINNEILKEISSVTELIASDKEIKAVIITGGNKVFAAGGDISYMVSADPLEAEQFMTSCHNTLDKLANLDVPVIAAIAGLALGGGCELALSCDIRIATEGTQIGLPEINLGIFPGGGGTQRLTRLVGSGWAKYMIMTGKSIDADTALKIGLITAVYTQENLMAEARKLALELAAKSSIAMRTLKRSINNGENVDLPSGLLFEQKTWALLFAADDAREGMTAFLEKRKAVFKDRI